MKDYKSLTQRNTMKPKPMRMKKLNWGFKDSDKDGVMNMLDCKPYNKKKQDRNELDEGFKFNYSEKERARKKIEADQAFKDLGIEVYE